MTLPGGLRAEDRCETCGGWHLSAPSHCTKCGKKFCAIVLRLGMCLDCDLADVVERGLRCERDDSAHAPRNGCECLTCTVSQMMP